MRSQMVCRSRQPRDPIIAWRPEYHRATLRYLAWQRPFSLFGQLQKDFGLTINRALFAATNTGMQYSASCSYKSNYTATQILSHLNLPGRKFLNKSAIENPAKTLQSDARLLEDFTHSYIIQCFFPQSIIAIENPRYGAFQHGDTHLIYGFSMENPKSKYG